MYEITRCQMREKNNKKFGILDLFDRETGATSRVLVSESYMNKLHEAIKAGMELHIGYDKARKCEFVYAK